MAKRKMAGRKPVVKKAAKPARKAAKKAARKKASTSRKAVARKAAPKKAAARKVSPKKAAPRKAAAKKAGSKKTAARRIPVRRAAPVLKRPARVVGPIAKAAKKTTARRPGPARAGNTAPIRGAIPSSLVSGGSSSSARTGREELLQHIKEHNETSPAITAGDVDADWQLAYSSGDEAPGGDNPTPDQDVVDEIGEALGVNYEDGEELKGAAKIEDRDKHRWELDPASKDDFEDN